ncbi:glycerate kinase [Opitutia bacterium ISCC 51]|nr:glycerate kinase [Opitutae bacterium ISCC 51]QXD28379.1 glycerate kinase [Opitutae bacterium ISCC 52]
MNVLICFDKFKDSMEAHEAGQIVESALSKTHPNWIIDTVALADGGEGFCEILTNSLKGALENHTVPGSILNPIEANLGWVAGEQLSQETRTDWKLNDQSKVAIIEMAQATGLQELPIDKRDCWKTSSFGTGQLIKLAVEAGAETILLGVGGSSTNDLGLGVLESLGLEFYDLNGERLISARPELWHKIDHLGGSLPKNLPPFKIACDVENPVFGPNGAAAIFGPQKGLKQEDHSRIEAEGQRIARLLCDYLDKPWSLTEVPGSGAAGGITFGLSTACEVELLPGFDLVAQWLNLPDKISACDWLITGEGKFDASSLQGKGPGTLAQTALTEGKRVTIMAGRIEVDKSFFSNPIDLIEISPRKLPLEEALIMGPKNLSRTVKNLET